MEPRLRKPILAGAVSQASSSSTMSPSLSSTSASSSSSSSSPSSSSSSSSSSLSPFSAALSSSSSPPPPSPPLRSPKSDSSAQSPRCQSPPLRRLHGSPGSSKPWNSLVLPTTSDHQNLAQDRTYMLDNIFSPSLAKIQEEVAQCCDTRSKVISPGKKRPPLLQTAPSTVAADAPKCAGIREQRKEHRSGEKVGWRPELSLELCSRPTEKVHEEPPVPRGSIQEANEGLEALEKFSAMMSGFEDSSGGLDFLGFTTGLLDLALGGRAEEFGCADSDAEEEEEEEEVEVSPLPPPAIVAATDHIIVRPPSQPKSARSGSRPVSRPAPAAPRQQQQQQQEQQQQAPTRTAFAITPPSAPAPSRRPKVATRSLQVTAKDPIAPAKIAAPSAMALDLGGLVETTPPESSHRAEAAPPASAPASASPYGLPNAWSLEETLAFSLGLEKNGFLEASPITNLTGKAMSSGEGAGKITVSVSVSVPAASAGAGTGSLLTPRKASLLPAIVSPRPAPSASNWRVGPLPEEDRWFR